MSLHVDRPKIYDGTPPSTLCHTPAVIADGFLQKFLELPVDIFTVICGYFEPLDLWNISISGHAFWDILTSPDLRPIWVAARLRLYGPMPNPPEDMSEPEYARFLFSDKFFTCDGNATEIDFSNKFKSCPTCFKKHYLTFEEATLMFPGLPVRYYVRTSHGPSNLGYEKRHYYRMAITREFRLYVDHISKGGSKTEFEIELEERCCLIDESGRPLKTRMDSENARQQEELEAAYKKRKASIVARMVELGHDGIDVDCGAADSRGLLHLPYNVTDEEWTSMRSALEEDAIRHKALRKARERTDFGCTFRFIPRSRSDSSDSDSDPDFDGG